MTLHRPEGGGVASAVATTTGTKVTVGNRRGMILTVDAPFRLGFSEADAILTPSDANMGYFPAGTHEIEMHTADGSFTIAATTGTVNYYLAWML